jgi:hypothetical protein
MSETEQITPESGAEQFDRCEQCHAPVDRDQRYCVNCGAHQRQVPDPAAKYMSRVSAHTGSRGALLNSSAGAGVAGARRRSFGGIGLLGALALALIPVAAAVGIAIGRSSNNQDGKLIRALENQRAQVTTTLVGSSGTAAAAGTGASSTAATKQTTKNKAAAKAKSKTKAKAKTASTSSTSDGKATKITSKVTASQASQGASEAKKIQSATGKNYVQAANNLPDSVAVGP